MRSLPLLVLVAACKTAPDDPPCPPPPPERGEVRLRQLACAQDLVEGDHAAGRVGDWVLENAHARFVVRDGPEGHALYGLAGGGLVDAVHMADGVQQAPDALRELQMTAGFWMIGPESFDDLSTGSEARLRIAGDWQSMVTLHEVLPIPEPSTRLVQEYVLDAESATLRLITRSTSGDPVPALADLQFWSGAVRPWLPGLGADVPQTGSFEQLAFEPFDDGTAAALAGEGGTIIAIGPVLATGWAGQDTEVVRELTLAPSLSEAMAPHWASSEVVHEDVPLVEVRNADGAPLTRCRQGRPCAAPDAASTIEVWNDDGNGHWSQPLQADVATISVQTDGPFRLSAWGPDRRVFVDADGVASFRLPPGTWELFLTRGPGWTLHTETVELQPGDDHLLAAVLDHVVAHPGWVAADLHVHTERSPDSWVPVARRLEGAMAEDLDVVVLTEHDTIGEGAIEGLLVVRGAEISTMRLGHFNAFPLTPDPDLSGNGAPRWHGTDLAGMVAAVPGDALLQCNHPRFVDGGYAALFDWIALDETTDPALLPCDAVEVFNGTTEADTDAVFADWLMLLQRDIRMTATGVSDSHLTADPLGHPRTLVRVDGPVTEASVIEALRAGRAIATGGPLLELQLSSGAATAGIGDTLAASGPIQATLTVSAPDWMALGTVELYVDGVLVHSEAVDEVQAVGGLKQHVIEVGVADDATNVVAQHRGSADNRPGARRSARAVTNPVWVE